MLSCSASCLLLETFPFFPACSLTLKTSLGQVNKFQAMEDIFQAKTSQKNVCRRINHAHQIKLRELNTKGKQIQMIILIANPRTHIIFQRHELFLMYHKFFLYHKIPLLLFDAKREIICINKTITGSNFTKA